MKTKYLYRDVSGTVEFRRIRYKNNKYYLDIIDLDKLSNCVNIFFWNRELPYVHVKAHEQDNSFIEEQTFNRMILEFLNGNN